MVDGVRNDTWLKILDRLKVKTQGLKQRSSGAIYLCCVFHSEKTASMVLRPDGRFQCYGCRARGSWFTDFVHDLRLHARPTTVIVENMNASIDDLVPHRYNQSLGPVPESTQQELWPFIDH
jgi:hypothetical protein